MAKLKKTTRPRARRPAQPNARAREPKVETVQRTLGQQAFLLQFAETGIVLRAAEAAGVGRRTVYEWLERDPEFKKAYLEAEQNACDLIEAECLRRARDGWDEPVFQGGELVGTVRKFSDRLLELTLKARRPEKFRERYEHVGAGGGPINVKKTVVFGGRYKPPAKAL